MVKHSPSCYRFRTQATVSCACLCNGDNGIIIVLLSLQKDVIDVLNEKIYDVEQEEVAQRVEKEEGVRC